jgi:hypothetical protein
MEGLMNNNELAKELAKEVELIIEQDKKARAKRIQLKNTVINLSNPKSGQVIHFGDYDWIITGYIAYPEDANLAYNRGIIMLNRVGNRRLYTVPMRLNGNVEYRTLRQLLYNRADKLTQEPTNLLPDLPYDVQIVRHYAGWNDGDLHTIGNHYMFMSRQFDEQTSEEVLNQTLRCGIWAVNCIGGIIHGQPRMTDSSTWSDVDDPYIWYEETEEWIIEDEEAYKQAWDKVVSGYSGMIEFSIKPLLPNDQPVPDVALIEKPQNFVPQTVKIYPNDIEHTANILSRYFNLDELIRVLNNHRAK